MSASDDRKDINSRPFLSQTGMNTQGIMPKSDYSLPLYRIRMAALRVRSGRRGHGRGGVE
jgi:hypothetical protein